ncbi:hypothetical protein N783_04895 [Pontibacillus marinus BH030004 = DSM 16465]|uniref:Uncharacterized protein n=1 Tax=Pontibacillus marinus BH030004 = DSM 16465 TaxID=1385511 RepID=A0A0A5GF09_9BACI|nr:hypothetical protein N783_04895 [Pontibacillus marinus BH030004 = DSM 16465]
MQYCTPKLNYLPLGGRFFMWNVDFGNKQRVDDFDAI